MKIVALMIVVNEEDYVYYSLKSIYDCVDEIIIVEGAALDMWNNHNHFTPAGLSIDNTNKEIQRFIKEDTEHKVNYIQAGFQPTMNTLRNISLQSCPKDTNYCLVVDADQLYDRGQLKKVRNICTLYPNIKVVYGEQLMFFWDMQHILTVDRQHKKASGFHLPMFYFRYSPELRYFSEMSYQDHCLGPGEWFHSAPLVSGEELPSKKGDVIIYPPLFQFWHFGWVKKKKELERHLLRFTGSQINKVKKMIENKQELLGTDKTFWAPLIGKSDDYILEQAHFYHKLWTGVFDEKVEERLIPYEGEYPPIIKEHPYFGKSKVELGWEETL